MSAAEICVHSPGRRLRGEPSHNLGDVVIERAVIDEFHRQGIAAETVRFSSLHLPMSEAQRRAMRCSRLNLLGGSNAIGWPWLHKRSSWRILPQDLTAGLDFVLMGVGWSAYETRLNLKTRFYLRRLLHRQALHSVRDRHSERVLRQLGFTNVVYTGCPSMWGFTPDFCRRLPTAKRPVVLTMITDYRMAPSRDRMMLEVLARCYDEVVVLPQGRGDEAYLRELGFTGRVLSHDLDFVERMQADYGAFDYVGTRLHGGIHCLQRGVRSLIVEVDNRAREIAQDTGLATVRPEAAALEAAIEGPVEQRIRLPVAAIERWRQALKVRLHGGEG